MNLSKKVDSEEFLSTICTHTDEVLSLITQYSLLNGKFSEDLRSDIFLYLLEHAGHKYDGSVNVNTFCVSVAKQQAMNAYAKELKYKKMLNKYRKVYKKNRLALYERGQNIHRACRMIDEETNPQLKEILSRRFIQNEKLAKISTDLNISINEVRKQVSDFVEKNKET